MLYWCVLQHITSSLFTLHPLTRSCFIPKKLRVFSFLPIFIQYPPSTFILYSFVDLLSF
ncbi:hypothetical protein HanIR_Chr15g0753461 [Helianthus annuus]|nr:hypothetical protein HanIR_Chr15g0753461 [Helianthus annuus]